MAELLGEVCNVALLGAVCKVTLFFGPFVDAVFRSAPFMLGEASVRNPTRSAMLAGEESNQMYSYRA